MKHNLKKQPKRKKQKGGVQERSSGRYQAKLTTDGKQKFLGTFDTKTEAACTYDQATHQTKLSTTNNKRDPNQRRTKR
jgi:hypothetical protein